MKVLCILTNLFEDIEAVGTIALLRRANIEIDVYSLHEESAIGRFNINISNLKNLKDLNVDDYDCLFICGGPEYIELEKNDFFINVVEDFYKKQKYIAAICAAPTILGHLGMLKDVKYTCFTSMNEDFGGTYIDEYAVHDKKFITGRSCAAVIDFALLIIKVLGGAQLEQNIKKQIYYDR